MFPDPRIREAYLSPVVDLSPEPFQWALPDAPALHAFLQQRLSWNILKCNEILMPVIKRVNQARTLIDAGEGTRAQTTLDGFITKQNLPAFLTSGGRTKSKRVAKAVSRLRGQEDTTTETTQPITPKKRKASKRQQTKKNATETQEAESTSLPSASSKQSKRRKKSSKGATVTTPATHQTMLLENNNDDDEEEIPSIPSDSDAQLLNDVAAIEAAHAQNA